MRLSACAMSLDTSWYQEPLGGGALGAGAALEAAGGG
jgi:hypothetical protein